MKKININPVGLKGKEINERIIQLMGKTAIEEDHGRSVVELTKIGPDGKAYGVVRENHEYYIKVSDKTSGLMTEDFKYIGGLQNKKAEVYPSYAKAIKHLNLTFKSLAEAYGKGGDINIFVNDKLMKENMGVAAGGFGFSNEGNLDGNTGLYEEEDLEGEVVEAELEEEVLEEVDLSEDEAYVDAMLKEDDDEDEDVPENKEDYTKQPATYTKKKVVKEEKKYVLKLAGSAPTPPPAPVEPVSEPADDAGFGDLGGDEMPPEEPTDDGMPFDKEPFDAGVEASEEEDPKKYIEQLTGKLGQSLRDYTEKQGQPDFELEKFSINSLLSATHTADMDEQDKEDIIKKVNTSGDEEEGSNDFGDSDNETDFDMPDDSGDEMGNDGDFGGDMGDGEDEEIDEIEIFESEGKTQVEIDNPLLYPDGWKEIDGIMFDIAKKNNMFQDGANDKLKDSLDGYLGEGLLNSKKNRIFNKNYVLTKLHESLNQDDMQNSEPMVEPAPTKTPVTTPVEKPIAPSRRNKPFLPMPEVDVPPKAKNSVMDEAKGKQDYETYHKTFSSAVQTARQMAEDKGYQISDEDWFREIATGPRKPQNGQTNRYTLPLYVDGKEQRKALHIQVYGMVHNYELNAYIS